MTDDLDRILPLPAPEPKATPAEQIKHLQGLQARADRAMKRAQRKMGYGGYAGMAANGRYAAALREWKDLQARIEELEREVGDGVS